MTDEIPCHGIWAAYCDYRWSWGHGCELPVGHDGRHECPCGSSWSDQ